jgi:hypothetical protein
MSPSTRRSRSLPSLRSTLLWDSLACVLSGSALLMGARPAYALLAPGLTEGEVLSPVGLLRLLGAGVLAIGVYVAWVARGRPISAPAVAPILAVEVLWVMGSLALLARADGLLTAAGRVAVGVGAVAVLAFLVLEVLGLRAESGSRRPVEAV